MLNTYRYKYSFKPSGVYLIASEIVPQSVVCINAIITF